MVSSKRFSDNFLELDFVLFDFTIFEGLKMNINGLEKLVYPMSSKEFFERVHEERWHHYIEELEGLTELFNSSHLEEYLYTARPWMVPGDNELMCAKFPEKGFIPKVHSMEEVLMHYANGYTIILNTAQLRWKPISKICSELSNDVFGRVGANIYLTPPNSQGFKAHYDSHDVCILQTEGTKKWKVNNVPQLPLPSHHDSLRNEFYKIDPEKDTKDAIEVELKAGQRLYLPRGTIHSGMNSGDSASVHITFAMFPITWTDFFVSTIIDGSIGSAELSKTVPFELLQDLQSDKSKIAVKTKFKEVFDGANFDSLWRLMYARNNALLPGGGVQSIHNIDSICIESTLKIREAAEIFVDTSNSNTWLSVTGKKIKVAETTIDYFYYIMEHPTFKLSELPNNLSTESTILFGKWLIRMGIATIEKSQCEKG